VYPVRRVHQTCRVYRESRVFGYEALLATRAVCVILSGVSSVLECVDTARCAAITTVLWTSSRASRRCQVCRVCRHSQVCGYHDCAMDILTCVTDLFASNKPAATVAGVNSTTRAAPLPPLVDLRRYRAVPSPPLTDVDLSTGPRRDNTPPRPLPQSPAKPASLPSLSLSDNGHPSYPSSIFYFSRLLLKTRTGLPVEEPVRMTEDRAKWRKYVQIEDG